MVHQFEEVLLLFAPGVSRLDDQIFINRNPGVPSVVKFHPFNTCIAVADKDSIWSERALTTESHTSLVLLGNGRNVRSG